MTDRIASDLTYAEPADVTTQINCDADICISGFGSVGYPKAIPSALAECENLSLTIVSGGSVGDIVDTRLVEVGAIDRRYPYQARSASREAINNQQIEFNDTHIARLGEAVLLGHLPSPDVAVVEAVAAGRDWFVPSTSIGQTQAFVEAADQLVIEINHAQPLSLRSFHDIYRVGPPPRDESIPLQHPGGRIGTSKITFDKSKLAAVVQTDRPDSPYEFRSPTSIDETIANNLSNMLYSEIETNPALTDRICLQFGVGSLGNALMSSFRDLDFDGRDVVYYGEVIQDGILDMLDSETLMTASATALALSTEGTNRLFDNQNQYSERIVLRPAAISNRASLIDRFGVIAINSALEVDIYGHVNSTHAHGTELINGIGGSGDFIRNGLLGIVALPSQTADGDASRIVPMVPHTDHTEHDVDVVVTEQGVADLRSLSPRERAEVLINECAHPSVRDDLDSYLTEAMKHSGHISHQLDSVWSWDSV